MTPLVSILIPVYNRETIIAETLESAISQTHPNIEVIVVDNASTDNTWGVIQGFASKDNRIKSFRNETNLGPVRNWLRCVDESSGEFGKILWSDDLIAPEFIEKCLPLFDADTAFVYSGVKIFHDGVHTARDGNPCYFIGMTGHFDTSKYIDNALLGENVPVSPGCALFRMCDLRKNLLVDIETKVKSDFAMHAIGNDLLLFLLTANSYSKFGFVAEALSFFRAHAGSISISSSDGKLPLHYMLVRAYFSERYRSEMRSLVMVKAWLLLKKYPDHSLYGLNSVNDFFFKQFRVDVFALARILLNRAVRNCSRIIRKNYSKSDFVQ